MQRFGLSGAEFRTFLDTLATSHEVTVSTTLTTLDDRVISRANPRLLAGEVLTDATRFGTAHGPYRRATLSLLDPRNVLGIDTTSPADGALYYDRKLHLTYGVRVPELGRVVECPVFCGIPTKIQRSAGVVEIEADDASVQGMGACWSPLQIPKHTRKVVAIRRILAERAGFTRFRFPDRKARLRHPVSLGRLSQPWAVADRIARSMDLQLFVDGTGAVVLRELPRTPLYTFAPGQGGTLVAPVNVSTTGEGFANVVQVLGAKPKGSKRRVRAVATPPRRHPLSPWSLAQDDVPHRVVLTVENDHIKTKAEARQRAERRLEDALRSRVEVTASVLPMPLFDPLDLVALTTSEGDYVEHRLRTFSLPLYVDGAPAMPIGWFGKPRPRKEAIRRKR